MSNDEQRLARIGDHVRYNTHTILGMIEGDVTGITFSDGGRVYAEVAWYSAVTPSNLIDLADLEVVETAEDRFKREGLAHVLTPAELARMEYVSLTHDDGLALLATVRAYLPLVEALAHYENSASDEEGCPFCFETVAHYDPHLPDCPVVLARVARGMSPEQATSPRRPDA